MIRTESEVSLAQEAVGNLHKVLLAARKVS